MDRRTFLLVAAAGTAAACGAGRGRIPTDTSSVRRPELIDTNSGSVYDALQKLRPGWLTGRGPRSATDPTPVTANVYMNTTRVGDVDYLRGVSPEAVHEVRYYTTAEALGRFGAHNPRGVIQIIPRR